MEHERILGVFAHPDDADVGCGASLAHFASLGAVVNVVVATLGDAGGFDTAGHDRIVEIRREEQEAAAAALGISEVTFLEGYRDGTLEPTLALVRDVVSHIRRYRPTLVITMNPEHNWESIAASHPDHRAIGEATVRAIYPAARNPFSFPELLEQGLEPWSVEEVWLQGHQNPNFVHAIGDADLQKKLAAVSCHASQFSSMEAVMGFVRGHAQEAGARIGATWGEDFLRYDAR